MDLNLLHSLTVKLNKALNTVTWKETQQLVVHTLENAECDYKSIITVVKKDSFGQEELNRLEYMIKMAKQVQNNKINQHGASVKVGQRLVDEIVKPQLDKKQ